MTGEMYGKPIEVALTDGVTYYDHENHVQTQAVLACVQEIFADEAWTVQVLAAAVMAEYYLDHGATAEQVAEILKDGLKGRLIR